MFILAAASALASTLPEGDVDWRPLSTGPVQVECATIDGEPWCRSYGLVHADIEQVTGALGEMSLDAAKLDSVRSVRVLEQDAAQLLLHITLDFPAPLSDRDYVAAYTRQREGETRVIRWTPTTHPDAPQTDAVVRMPRFAGEWRLTPRGEHTAVRYTWQADFNGTLPAFARELATEKAGSDPLKLLAGAQGVALSRL